MLARAAGEPTRHPRATFHAIVALAPATAAIGGLARIVGIC